MTNLNKPDKLLDRLYMAAPCSVGWENMQGDDRVRFCSACSKNVYNISDMTKTEAELFLQENGVTVCMRMYQRADGTIINDNCPVGLRKLRNGARFVWKSVATFVGLCLSISGVFAQGEKSSSESKTPLSHMNVQMFDGRPGIRQCEKLPSFETLTTGKRPLLKNEEVVMHNGAVAIVIEKPSNSTEPSGVSSGQEKLSSSVEKTTKFYYDLWDQFTANKALSKARESATQGDLKTANSFYKLLMKFFESFDVYESSEKAIVIKEYAEFLESWKKPEEAAEVRKQITVVQQRLQNIDGNDALIWIK